MELDCYFPDGVRLSAAAAAARSVQDAGFAAMWVTETRHNPFLTCGVALAAAERIQAGSGIAVAFPRSPMVTAQLAWDLAEASGGRFVLGLGSRAKRQTGRTSSPAFARPVPRVCPGFGRAGAPEGELGRQRAAIARQIAFYGSSRTYRPVFDTHGWGDVCGELHHLMSGGDAAAMPSLVTAEMVDAFSVTAAWNDLAAELRRRYAGLVDRVAPYGAVLRSAQDRRRWRGVAASLG